MSSARDTDAVRGVVLDIEGTTTPVSFVYEILFPYARERLGEFLSLHRNDAVVREALARLAPEWSVDAEAHREPLREPTDLESAEHYLKWLMDRDRKSTALKVIQGEIWRGGFESGVLRGDVYADVQPALERWRTAGRTIAIYSSGSAAAQRLLFGHSSRGDLTPLIDAYFDTKIGAKRSTDSYSAIARALELPANDLLFVSDVEAELVAARAARFQTRLCVRGDAAPPTTSRIIHTFDEL